MSSRSPRLNQPSAIEKLDDRMGDVPADPKLDRLAGAFLSWWSFLSVASLLLAGCSSFRGRQSDGLVKPLTTASTDMSNGGQSIPDERTLCIETAKTVAGQGHAEEAIKLYERAEQFDASQKPLNVELAPLYAQAGDFDAAIERYQQLATKSPQDTELCNNFAWTLMDAQRYSEAIAEAGRGLTLEIDNKRLRRTLAMIHYRQGDRTSAWEQFAKAQGPAAAHHNLAVLDIDAGNVESAREHLRQADKIAAVGHGEVSSQTKTLLAALNQQEEAVHRPVQR